MINGTVVYVVAAAVDSGMTAEQNRVSPIADYLPLRICQDVWNSFMCWRSNRSQSFDDENCVSP
jgi:hypothetical protein